MNRCFAVAAPGLEAAVAGELGELGLDGIEIVDGGVEFDGGLEAGMRACLWLRCATTVRLRIGEFAARSMSAFASGFARLPLEEVCPFGSVVPLQVTARSSRMKHTGRLLDAAVAARPGIDWRPGTGGIHVRLHRDEAEVSVDLAGERLQLRGWRLEGGAAPLRETLASGLLRLCGWTPEETLVDPMCGSGTLPIEAALRATCRPPGQDRRFAFEFFPSFRHEPWEALVAEAAAKQCEASSPIVASDAHRGAVGSTTRNAKRAGVESVVVADRVELADLQPPPGPPGLLLTNPPYGERIGARKTDLASLYRTFGEVLRSRFAGWRVGILAADPRYAELTDLELDEGLPLRNGGLRVRLYQARL